jgi:hypothetical protein
MPTRVRQLPVSSYVKPRAATAVVLILLLLLLSLSLRQAIGLYLCKCPQKRCWIPSLYFVSCTLSSTALSEQSIYLNGETVHRFSATRNTEHNARRNSMDFCYPNLWLNFMIITCRSSLTTSHRYPQHTHVTYQKVVILTHLYLLKPWHINRSHVLCSSFVRSKTTLNPNTLLF